jgi:hypothetical protein
MRVSAGNVHFIYSEPVRQPIERPAQKLACDLALLNGHVDSSCSIDPATSVPGDEFSLIGF